MWGQCGVRVRGGPGFRPFMRCLGDVSITEEPTVSTLGRAVCSQYTRASRLDELDRGRCLTDQPYERQPREKDRMLSRTSGLSSSTRNDNLAEMAATLEMAVGIPGLSELERSVYDRPQAMQRAGFGAE